MKVNVARQLVRWSPLVKYLVVVSALAALYVVTARIGLSLALPPEGKSSAVWPPSGIALAGVLIFGYRVWPGIWLGAFFGNLWDYFQPAAQFSLASHLMVSSGIAVGSTLQPLLGAYLIRHLMGGQNPLDSAGNAFRFVGIAVLMCLVASTIGVGSLFAAGFTTWGNLGFNWLTWWLGDLMGVLVITPLALTWRRAPDFSVTLARVSEAVLLLVLLLGVGLLSFGRWDPLETDGRFLLYLTIPPLIWAALRFGQHGATAGLLLMLGMAVWGTTHQQGPWVMPSLNDSLMLLQTFMGVLTLTTLALVGVLTERRRVEAALREGTQRLHLAQEAGHIGVWDWDLLTGELHWDGVEPIHGLDPGSFGGSFEAYLQDVHPQDRDAVVNAVEHAIEHGGELDHEYRVVWPDGSTHWVQGKGHAFQDEHGRTVRLTGTCHDITRRKESEERFRSLIEHSYDAIAVIDQKGVFTYLSPSVYTILGLAPEALVGTCAFDLIHPDEIPDAQAAFDQLLQSPDSCAETGFRARRADGEWIWLEVSSINLLHQPAVSGVVVNFRDITQRKQAELELRENEERYKLVLAGADAAIWDWDVPAKRVLYSPRWKELRGLSDNEVSDHEEEWSKGIHPDDFSAVMAAVQAHFDGRTPFFAEEYRVRHKDGHWLWILDRGIARRDSSGRVVRMAGSETDITERKLAQEQLMARVESQLRESMELFYSLFEFAPDAILVVKENGIIIRANSQSEQLFGYTRQELVGRSVERLLPDRFVARHVSHRSDYLQDPHTRPVVAGLELFGRRKDGSEFPVDIMLSPVDTQGGRLVLEVVRDVTERQESEKALEFQGQIIRNMAEGVVVVQANDGTILYTNPKFEEMFGYGPGELTGKPVSVLNHPGEKSPEQVAKEIISVLEEKGAWAGEIHNVKKDGTPFWSHANASAFDHPEYQNVWISTQVDITEWKAAEEALWESEARYRSLVESANAAIVIADETGNIVSWNHGAMNIFGHTQEEVLGRPVTVLMPQRYHEAHQRAMERLRATGEGSLLGKSLEFQALRKDGSEFPVELSLFSWETGSRRFLSGIIHDISERRVAEERTREALRREVLLKEEVHHRVKNNLQVVNSLLYLQSLGISDQMTREMLLDCQSRVKSIALVHEKLHRSADLERVNLDEYVRDLVADLLRTYEVYQHHVRVHTDINGISLGVDTATPCGLIISELVANALKHAFPDGREGDLWIEVHPTGEMRYSLTVRDNGVGFPRGFNLEGSRSLGLRLVQDLTKQLQGEVAIENGNGAAFHIAFKELEYAERW